MRSQESAGVRKKSTNLFRKRTLAEIPVSLVGHTRQIQWDFNQSWHRQFLLKPCCLTANLVIGETSRASHAKQSIGAHKILWRHGSYGRAMMNDQSHPSV